MIIGGDGQKGTIFFTELVKDNSFWNDQGVQPGDVIKTINGTTVSIQNANQVLQEVYMWKPGKDIEVLLDRNGKEVIIKTKTTPSYTMGEGILEQPNATEAQKNIREAWLKG